MREIGANLTEKDGRGMLELQFKTLDQVLDMSDPHPLPHTELTEFAEGIIAGYVDEFPLARPIDLTVCLPRERITPDMRRLLPAAIRRHFGFRIGDLDHDKRLSWREGKISLINAIVNAVIAILFVMVFARYLESSLIVLLGGLITILNWVTIWHTYEHFAYDYRQMARRMKIYKKISDMAIRIEGCDPAGGTGARIK